MNSKISAMSTPLPVDVYELGEVTQQGNTLDSSCDSSELWSIGPLFHRNTSLIKRFQSSFKLGFITLKRCPGITLAQTTFYEGDICHSGYVGARSQEVLRRNQTTVVEFLLLGFHDLGYFRIPFFIFIAFLYTATVAANLSIFSLISSSSSSKLKSPMYIFLSHLSLSDVLISTNVAPNAFLVILLGEMHMPAAGCLTQLYFFGASCILECCLLTVMSYDRYLAICRPLRYTSVMNAKLLNGLITYSWMVGFLQPLITHTLILQLDFCGPNVIDHFFCDVAPLLELSCSDKTLAQIEVSIVALFVGLLQLVFIVITYVLIFHSIYHMSSKAGKEKAFSTCSSHMAVVFTYYGTLIILYLSPSRGYSFNLNKMLSLINTVVTPFFNPIIYTLRNQEIRTALKGVFRSFKIK
ncbi:olfactory receptor 11A1-like [Rhinoderma darwinii]|uniref:olfactory receptor 11A1-like n=1 Tax=Rhinoderma darwinii TaxID=43563 RepID=UPI003F664E13